MGEAHPHPQNSEYLFSPLGLFKQPLRGSRSSLNLAFLDPEGLELNWSTVQTLALVQKMDLIIYYPEGGLNRYMGYAYKQEQDTIVDSFFGGREWRDVYGDPSLKSTLQGHLLELYKNKLHNLGYQEVVGLDEIAPLMRNTHRNAPLYRLLFASKHPIGHKFWQAVTKKDADGQTRFDFDNLM